MLKAALACLCALVLGLSIGGSQTAIAQTVVVHPASSYSADTAAMDATLGISGYAVEDFEDTALVAGLTIEHTNPSAGPTSTLPVVYTDGSASFFNNRWDGPGSLISTFNNQIWFPPEASEANLSERVTFHLSPPVQTFGIGLGNFQAERVDHAVLVDGIVVEPALEALGSFTSGINVRNGYLLIQAAPGGSISSVSIETRANGTTTPVQGADSDGLIFDHLAFSRAPAVPALGPRAIGLFAGSILWLTWLAIRRQNRQPTD